MADETHPILDEMEDSLDDLKRGDNLEEPGWFDTGNYALNWAVSNRLLGGYPVGSSVELFGESNTGKSFLIQRAIAQVHAEGGFAVLDDAENAFYADRAEQVGVDLSRLVKRESDTLNEHHKLLEEFLQRATEHSTEDTPFILALDSIGDLTTEQAIEHGLETDTVGKKAKNIKKLFRLVANRLADHNVLYVIANHVYDSPDPFTATKSSGGKGLEYRAGVRIALKHLKTHDGDRGVKIRGKVKKTRYANPFREFEINIPFHGQISRTSGLIPVLLHLGVLEMRGHRLNVVDPGTGEVHETPIYAQKTNPLKQDQSGEQLVEEFPGLLERTDEMIRERERERKFGGQDDE